MDVDEAYRLAEEALGRVDYIDDRLATRKEDYTKVEGGWVAPYADARWTVDRDMAYMPLGTSNFLFVDEQTKAARPIALKEAMNLLGLEYRV